MQAQQPKSPIHSVLWVRLTLISKGPDYAGPTQEEKEGRWPAEGAAHPPGDSLLSAAAAGRQNTAV